MVLIPTSKFKAVATDQEFVLLFDIDRQMGKKLSKPIYEFQYTNRNNQIFTCYLDDIIKSFSFGSWVRI